MPEDPQQPLSALAEALETAVRETDRNRTQTEELLVLACEVVAHSTQGTADVLDAAIKAHEDAAVYLTRARDAALAAV